jgi:hypothetical protein
MTAQVHLALSFCILHKLSLLVVETNRYYHNYIDRLDDGPSPEPDVTEAKSLFLTLTVQMGHGIRDKLTDR